MKVFLSLFFIFALNIITFAQTGVIGRVVDIIDGKTIMIETAAEAKLNVKLQFIEVPELGQSLADVVKEHLRKLALGKTVLLQARSLSGGAQLIGRVLNGNIDLSEQMLRDGAAWYAILEKDSQDSNEHEVYQTTEKAAKSERRGVWGIEGLRPAWEFRAEKQASKPISATKSTPSQPLRQTRPVQIGRGSDKTAGTTPFKPKSLKSLQSAQEFFEECDKRARNFDISLAECYSDKSFVRNTRRYPSGRTRILEFTAAQWKKLILEAMPIAKQLNDYSTFSNVTYTTEGKRIRINATRYSERKKYYSPISILVGRDSSGSWRTYEEISESQP
jgi:endonuclease YncB( thermonuclease family)